MLKRLGISAIAVICGIVLLGAPGHTFDAGSNVAAEAASPESLAGKCYVALWSGSPRLFGIEFQNDNGFHVSYCGPDGTYREELEFLVFTLWNAETCDASTTFEGLAIAGNVLLFRAEDPSGDRSGIAFRAPCGIFD